MMMTRHLGAACLTALLGSALPVPAAAQTAATPTGLSRATASTTGGVGSARTSAAASGAGGSASGASAARAAPANTAPAWLLCPPPGTGSEPFVAGTNLSCAP
jgi:hypothetical protein